MRQLVPSLDAKGPRAFYLKGGRLKNTVIVLSCLFFKYQQHLSKIFAFFSSFNIVTKLH